MMHRAAVSAALFVSIVVSAQARAEGETTTTTANTVIVVTPNAPVMVGAQAQPPAAIDAGPAAVAPALAPPGAAEMPPAPPAPPQNENWNNVSHINGTPVPVGERTAYLYAFKKTNVQTNPLGWMFGYYQIAAQHAVSQNVAVSVELSAWDLDHSNHTGYQLAATVPIYFRRTYSGPFLEAGLVIHNDNNNYYAYDCYDCTSSPSNTWVGPEVMFGWSWIFDSGLNMSFAFGAAKRMSTDNMSSSSSEPDPAGYFRVGYAF